MEFGFKFNDQTFISIQKITKKIQTFVNPQKIPKPYGFLMPNEQCN